VRALDALPVQPSLKRVRQGPHARASDRGPAPAEAGEVDPDHLVVDGQGLAYGFPGIQVASEPVDPDQRWTLACAFVAHAQTASHANLGEVNATRAQAYGRVVKTLEDLSESKLHADELQTVRDAADALFFCEDLNADPAAEQALAKHYELMDRLVESERVQAETTDRLTSDIEACGPFASVA